MAKDRDSYIVRKGHIHFDDDGSAPLGVGRAAIYARKSNVTENENASTNQQIEYCKRTASKLGFADGDVEVFCDEDGQKGTWFYDDGAGRNPPPFRPALTRLVAEIRRGRYQAVIVYKADRLYRCPGVCYSLLMNELIPNKVSLVANGKDYEIHTAEGLERAFSAAVKGRLHRDNVSEEVKRDHLAKAEEGGFARNPTCLGFRSNGRQRVEIVWDQIELVRRIFHLFVTGEDIVTGQRVGPLGVNAIANYLMNVGVVWPAWRERMDKSKIKYQAIATVLGNCNYVGRYRFLGIEYVCDKVLIPVCGRDGNPAEGGQRETVVSETMYEAAQAKLRSRKECVGRRALSAEHMLSGLVCCGRCGRNMTVAKLTTGQRYYCCRNFSGDGKCVRGSVKGIQEAYIDEWAVEELAPLIAFEAEAMRTSAGREADRQNLAASQRELDEAKQIETKKLSAMVAHMDAEQFGAVSQALREKRTEIQRRRDELKQRVDAADRAACGLDAEAVKTMRPLEVKDALSRSIKWIALCREGAIALTNWGTYIAAKYERRREDGIRKITCLAAPDPATTLTCLSMIEDPAHFVWGRRIAKGRVLRGLTDAEILPGAFVDNTDDSQGNYTSVGHHSAA